MVTMEEDGKVVMPHFMVGVMPLAQWVSYQVPSHFLSLLFLVFLTFGVIFVLKLETSVSFELLGKTQNAQKGR